MLRSPLHADLVEMLEATRATEHDLFGALPPERREIPGADGGWSAKDVWAHLAAWRSIEARRLEAALRAEGAAPGAPSGDDPAPSDPIDASNARLQAMHADWSWEAVGREADASVDALIDAIRRSSREMLCECDGIVAGLGSNGVNHAIGHLPEIATQAGKLRRVDRLAAETEAILQRDHLPARDTGVILYNLACHYALAGKLDEARRLLRDAFGRRPDLIESAPQDPDLVALGDELVSLAEPDRRDPA
ncbi:MAG TPA: hypothetical protein VLS28_03045 [Candidatus Sulfomarinibacteraceae bacterium]|nr:hypothetical protein [Candidatus Sulfomarinibacteraceae bacterium]